MRTVSRIINKNIADVFNIIIDIEKYPEFVPHCRSINILSKANFEIIAETNIEFAASLKHSYTSRIVYDVRLFTVSILNESKDFKRFYNTWKLIALGDNTTEIQFISEIEMSNPFKNFILQKVLDSITQKTIEAFVQRAKSIN